MAQEPSRDRISRRSMIRKTAAAVGGGAATMLGQPARAGQKVVEPAAARTPSEAGQTFRAYVRFGTSASVQELKLLPIAARQVVVRTEAAQVCYTTTGQGLGTGRIAQAVIPAHGGVGTVIEVGSSVDRVQVGERVIVAGQAQCGVCYNCLRGRADHCLMGNAGGNPNRPVAEMQDGTRSLGSGAAVRN